MCIYICILYYSHSDEPLRNGIGINIQATILTGSDGKGSILSPAYDLANADSIRWMQRVPFEVLVIARSLCVGGYAVLHLSFRVEDLLAMHRAFSRDLDSASRLMQQY